MTDAEMQLAGFFARYEPATAALGRALRAKLRARLPGLFEIVYFYENQNALVISYSPTEQGYEGLVSLALRPESVRLHFAQGARLAKADPKKLLRGSGTTRYVVLDAAADIDRADIEAWIAITLKGANVRLDPNARGAVIIKAEEQKRRAGRGKKAARPASPRRASKARG